jgi:hypothetical protein
MPGGGRIPQKDIQIRRDHVRDLWLTAKSTREIAEELFNRKVVNPLSGEKYDHSTIAHDIRELKKEYAEFNAEEISRQKAIQFAKLERLETKGWAYLERMNVGAREYAGVMGQLRETLKDQRSIYAMDAPKAQRHLGPDEGPMVIRLVADDEAGRL